MGEARNGEDMFAEDLGSVDLGIIEDDDVVEGITLISRATMTKLC